MKKKNESFLNELERKFDDRSRVYQNNNAVIFIKITKMKTKSYNNDKKRSISLNGERNRFIRCSFKLLITIVLFNLYIQLASLHLSVIGAEKVSSRAFGRVAADLTAPIDHLVCPFSGLSVNAHQFVKGIFLANKKH